MGSSCCHAESPCGSEEERSVLLKGDSKATAPTDDKVLMGSCGPGGNDGIRMTPDDADIKVEIMAEAVQVKQSHEGGEIEPNYTQENGLQQEVIIKTATPSPRRGSELKENSAIAQDEDVNNPPAGSEQADLLQCTLNSTQKQHATADWEVFTAAPEQKTASAQDKIPDISSQASKAVCSENHIVTNITGEHITSATPHDNQEEAGSTVDNAVDELSGDLSPNTEVLSLPNTQLPAAASQLSPISVVSQEIDTSSQCCATAEPAENILVSNETDSDLIKSHDVSESCSGSDPTGLNHSGEEQGSANCVRESETEALEGASRSSKSNRDAKTGLVCATTSSEATSFTNFKQDIGEEMILKGQDEDRDAPRAEEIDEMKQKVEMAPTEATGPAGKDDEIQEVIGKEEPAGFSAIGGMADEIPVTEKGNSAEDGQRNSEEDLYRGAGELSASQENKHAALHLFETTFLKVEDRFSLAPAMDILSYSEREWKGNTSKSALIRKGYKEMSQRFGSLRRVRGDNYCALRATLFQVLTHSTQLPLWLQAEDISKLPNQLESQEGLISQWTFPGECLHADGEGDATLQLQGYMELLRNTWQVAVDCSSAVERQQLCERVFQGGEEELGLLEALKLLMLGRSVELHSHMQAGEDVPLFCWLLFARDSSDSPRSFLSNHLSHVGLSAGLEQVEMFLLGYALQCTIQVYRLYKVDTEEFVTYYPDDHKDDWPSVSLVTEDDRHYNVPVVEAAEQMELDTS